MTKGKYVFNRKVLYNRVSKIPNKNLKPTVRFISRLKSVVIVVFSKHYDILIKTE